MEGGNEETMAIVWTGVSGKEEVRAEVIWSMGVNKI
jgi:hypothetical protein